MAAPKINIRSLRAFIAVYEEQSFSKAAARENATQSGMSTQVKNLETQLETPLLLRNRKQFELTPAGQVVYREGQAILRALLATETALEEMQGDVAGHVRFGMIPSLTRSVLIPALTSYKSEFPSVELTLLEEYSFSLMRRVLDAELDFALVPAGDLPAGLTARFVGRDREMLVSQPGALKGYPNLSCAPLGALTGKRLIVPTRLNVRRRGIEDLLNAHGVHVAEMLEMDGMLATLEMVATKDWMAILPSAICHPDKSGDVRQLNLVSDPPMTLDYVLVQKAETSLARAAELLAQRLISETTTILEDWEAFPSISKAETEDQN